MASTPSLTSLSEAERTAAQARFTQLRPHLQEGVPLAKVARDQGLPLRTLQRRVRQYRQDGLAGLARQRRADAGSRRLPDELLRLIEGLALDRPAPTAAAIRRRVVPLAGTNGWPVPSYGQVAAIIRHLDPGLASLAHEGSKEYRLRFDLLCRWQAAAANAAWQADHTPLDLWAHDERGRPVRPWLTVILDDYSRAVAGFRLSVTAPTALHTALALRDRVPAAAGAGAKPTRAGTSAASPTSSTPTTAAISPPATWSRSPPTCR